MQRSTSSDRMLAPELLCGFSCQLCCIFLACVVCGSVSSSETATQTCMLHADTVSLIHLHEHSNELMQGLDLSVKNFLTSVPLVADLRSPAMRERHWTQLMTTTKVKINSDIWHIYNPGNLFLADHTHVCNHIDL